MRIASLLPAATEIVGALGRADDLVAVTFECDHPPGVRDRVPVVVRSALDEGMTPAEIDAMRPAGRFVAEVLATLRAETKVGTNLLQLDRRAHEMIRSAGAESCYIDYHPSFGATPFGKVLCTSINDAVLHGIPTTYRLRDGDLLSADFGATLDGWTGDAATSFGVGSPSEADARLLAATERALTAAIAAARDGARVGDLSATIGAVHSSSLATRFHALCDRKSAPSGWRVKVDTRCPVGSQTKAVLFQYSSG